MYIYLTVPYAEISYKCRVIAVDIEVSDRIIDDSKFYKTDYLVSEGKYIRLELLKSYPEKSLTLKKIRENGVTSTFQGPTKVGPKLFALLRDLDVN